jgi:uncharacterized protein (DUF1501 family)
MALNLAAIGEAAAFNATDYKALVCVFLYGGNDYANTVVTYDDPSYNLYSAIRGGGRARRPGALRWPSRQLTPRCSTPPRRCRPRQYALHPSMTGLASAVQYRQGGGATQCGPAGGALTKAQYNSADRVRYPLPPKLFSHNDQQSIWQSSSPEGSTVGWGGNLGDLALGEQQQLAVHLHLGDRQRGVPVGRQRAVSTRSAPGGAVAINASRAMCTAPVRSRRAGQG